MGRRIEQQTILRTHTGGKLPISVSLACLLWALCAHAGQAPILMTVTTNYYAVTGTNAAEILQAMTQSRPWGQTFAYHARTDWDTKSTYSYRQIQGLFALRSYEVKSKVVIWLPRWVPAKDVEVDRDLAERWWQFLKGLSAHEQGHLQLARETAVDVHHRLGALQSFPSARELLAAADRAVKEANEEARRKEREYDQQTNHGMKQGAFFPHFRVKDTRPS